MSSVINNVYGYIEELQNNKPIDYKDFRNLIKNLDKNEFYPGEQKELQCFIDAAKNKYLLLCLAIGPAVGIIGAFAGGAATFMIVENKALSLSAGFLTGRYASINFINSYNEIELERFEDEVHQCINEMQKSGEVIDFSGE